MFDGTRAQRTKSLGRFCDGDNGPRILETSDHALLIRFRSDHSNVGRGFQLQYNTICDTEVTGLSGVIESPNFPKPYPHNRLELFFTEFQQRILMVCGLKLDYLKSKLLYHIKQETVFIFSWAIIAQTQDNQIFLSIFYQIIFWPEIDDIDCVSVTGIVPGRSKHRRETLSTWHSHTSRWRTIMEGKYKFQMKTKHFKLNPTISVATAAMTILILNRLVLEEILLNLVTSVVR